MQNVESAFKGLYFSKNFAIIYLQGKGKSKKIKNKKILKKIKKVLDNPNQKSYNKGTKKQENQIKRKKEDKKMEKKMTIVEKFAQVKAILEKNGETEMAEFIQERIDIQNKKAENKKPTKAQRENEVLKEKVLEVLRGAEVGMTATEVLNKDVETFVNVQKVTALLKALVDGGKVVKTVDKKKAYFTVA